MSAITGNTPVTKDPVANQIPAQKPAQSASQDQFTFNTPTIADSSMKRSI
ncbi:hypothetical protein [Aquirhabdus sp.]